MLVEVLVPIISSVLYDGGPEVDDAVKDKRIVSLVDIQVDLTIGIEVSVT